MLKKKFLCGFISMLMSVTVASASFYDVSAVAVTSVDTAETEETTDISGLSTGDIPLVTVGSEYDAVNGVKDAEELKTSDNDITKQSNITVPENIVSSSSLLNDKNRATKIKFSAGDQIIVSNDKKSIYSVYVIWDTPASEWTLSYNNNSVKGGQNGFLHEYIELDSPANEITLTMPSSSATVCDIYTFTEGDKPAWVQDWNTPCEQADMLVLPARGNNEVIDFGGLIPYYAGEKGIKVQVAYMVNQWLEYYRPHEILNALWECGVTYYPVFGDFSDCEVKTFDEASMVYNQDEVTEYVVSLIRRFKPQVVVGHDLKGEGGNGMSMIYATATAEASEVSADPNKYPDSAEEYGVWDVPKTYLHLYGYSEETDKFVEGTETAVETGVTAETTLPKTDDEATVTSEYDDETVTGALYNGDVEYLVKPITFDWRLSLEGFSGKSAYDIAQSAFACHKSQVNWTSMSEDGINTTAVYGLYRTNVGYDKGEDADMLENVDVNIPINQDDNTNSISSDIAEKFRGKRRSSPALFVFAIVAIIGTIGFTVWRKFIKK